MVLCQPHYYIVTIIIIITGNIHEMELTVQDLHGSTPLHIAARCGVSLYLDLIAHMGLSIALQTKDKQGTI